MSIFGKLALLAVISAVHAFGPKAGPYNIEIYKLESCEKQGTNEIYFKPRINNAGKGKYVYRDDFHFLVPMDEHFKMKAVVKKSGNGGWKEFTSTTFKNCEQLWKALSDFLKSLMKSAGVTVEKCPVPTGNFTANDWQIELNLEKTAPVMEYGEYKLILQFTRLQKLVGCLNVYANAVPK